MPHEGRGQALHQVSVFRDSLCHEEDVWCPILHSPSQEGIRKWYLGVSKYYDFPQGWESEELDTKRPLHESFVQGAEH